MREKLPDRRRCITQSIKIAGRTVHYTVGLYPDGRPGEVFIDMHRTGSAVRGWCGSTAKLLSLMLQYGIPLSELVDALVGDCTEPFGRAPVTGHSVIFDTSGVLDAVMRSLALDFLAASGAKHPKQMITCFFDEVADLEATEIYDLLEEAGMTEAFDALLEKLA